MEREVFGGILNKNRDLESDLLPPEADPGGPVAAVTATCSEEDGATQEPSVIYVAPIAMRKMLSVSVRTSQRQGREYPMEVRMETDAGKFLLRTGMKT